MISYLFVTFSNRSLSIKFTSKFKFLAFSLATSNASLLISIKSTVLSGSFCFSVKPITPLPQPISNIFAFPLNISLAYLIVFSN